MANDEEEYTIMPQKSMENLKKELDDLKKKTAGGDIVVSKELLYSVDNLSKSINGMMELFKIASEEMKLEEREKDVVSEKLDPLSQKLDSLIEQNQKIAKGIVAVADMVREDLPKLRDEIRFALGQLKESQPLRPPVSTRAPLPPVPGSAIPQSAQTSRFPQFAPQMPNVESFEMPSSSAPAEPMPEFPPFGESGNIAPPGLEPLPPLGGMPPPPPRKKGLFGMRK